MRGIVFTFHYNQNFSLNFLVVSFTLLICSRMSISQSSAFIPTNKILFIIHFNSSIFFWNLSSVEELEIRKRRKRGNVIIHFVTDSDRESGLFITNVYDHRIISECPKMFCPSSSAYKCPNNCESLFLDYFPSRWDQCSNETRV